MNRQRDSNCKGIAIIYITHYTLGQNGITRQSLEVVDSQAANKTHYYYYY